MKWDHSRFIRELRIFNEEEIIKLLNNGVSQVDITRILIELTLYAKSRGKRYNNANNQSWEDHYMYSTLTISTRLKLSTCKIVGYNFDAEYYYLNISNKGSYDVSILRIRGSDPYK